MSRYMDVISVKFFLPVKATGFSPNTEGGLARLHSLV